MVIADLRVVLVAEHDSRRTADDAAALDDRFRRALRADEPRDRIVRWYAASGVDRVLVDRAANGLSTARVAAALRLDDARAILARYEAQHGRRPAVLDALAACTADAGSVIFNGLSSAVGRPTAWLPFGCPDADAVAMEAAVGDHTGDHAGVDVDAATDPGSILRRAPVRGGIAGLVAAIESGCRSWLQATLTDDAVERIALLAVSVLARQEAKRRTAGASLATQVAAYARPADRAWVARRRMADMGLHTLARQLVVNRLITLPRTLAFDGRIKADHFVSDPTSTRVGIGRVESGKEANLVLGAPQSLAGQDITKLILDEVRSFTPYAIDVVLAVLSLVAEDVLDRGHPDRPGASKAHLTPTHITWDMITTRMDWQALGRSPTVEASTRTATYHLLAKLGRVGLEVVGAGADGDEKPLFNGNLLMVRMGGRQKYSVQAFDSADIAFGDILAHSLFERKLLHPAVIDAGNLFEAAGLASGLGATARETGIRQDYQLLSLAIDGRTREAVRGGAKKVILSHDEMLMEVGIARSAPTGTSRSNASDYRSRYDQRVRYLLETMRGRHIADYEAVEAGWEIHPSARMVEANTVLLDVERQVFRPVGGGQRRIT